MITFISDTELRGKCRCFSLFEDFDNVFHVPELAPQEDDIQTSEASMNQLRALVNASDEKNIRLACFCSDDEEGLCHRSIVAGLLLNMGARVDCNEDYRVYRLCGQ